MKNKHKNLGYIFMCGILLAGCSHDFDVTTLENKQADEIFALANKKKKKKNYKDAITIYEELEKLYPYSRHIASARLKEGICNYKLKKYDEATSSFEIFVKTHPTHEEVPYALYMLGVIHFEQMPIVERDQDVSLKALTYFRELVGRYPSNNYAKESEKFINALLEQLAAREVYVARFYQSRHNFAAAINRLNTVVYYYGNTKHLPEAFHRLTECYITLGLFDEAEKTTNVLKKKFKDSEWTQRSINILNKYGKKR